MIRYFYIFISTCFALSLNGYSRQEIEALEQGLAKEYPGLFKQGSGYTADEVEAMYQTIGAQGSTYFNLSGDAFKCCTQRLWDAYSNKEQLSASTRESLKALHNSPEPSMLECLRLLAHIAADVSMPSGEDLIYSRSQDPISEYRKQSLERVLFNFNPAESLYNKYEFDCPLDETLRENICNHYAPVLDALLVRHKIVPLYLPCVNIGEFGVGSLLGGQMRGELWLTCAAEDTIVHGQNMCPIQFIEHDAMHQCTLNASAYWGFRGRLLGAVMTEQALDNAERVKAYFEFCCSEQAQMLKLVGDFYAHLLKGLKQAKTPEQKERYAGCIVALFWLIHEGGNLPQRNFSLTDFDSAPKGPKSWENAFLELAQALKPLVAEDINYDPNISFSLNSEQHYHNEALEKLLGKALLGLEKEDEAAFAEYLWRSRLPKSPWEQVLSSVCTDSGHQLIVSYTLDPNHPSNQDRKTSHALSFDKAGLILNSVGDLSSLLIAAGFRVRGIDLAAIAPENRLREIANYIRELFDQTVGLGLLLEEELKVFFKTLESQEETH